MKKKKKLSQETIKSLDIIFAPSLPDSKTIQGYKKKLRKIDDIIDSQYKNSISGSSNIFNFTTVFNELTNQNLFKNLSLDHENNSIIFNLGDGINIRDQETEYKNNELQQINKLLQNHGIRKKTKKIINEALNPRARN